MKKLKFILLFLFLVAILSDCRKKYEEDPFYTLKSPQRRLAGNWELVSVYVDGADSTEFKRSSGGYGCKLYIDIERDKGVIFISCDTAMAHSFGTKEWSFDQNRNLDMGGALVYPIVGYLTHYILKLYNGELIFKVTQPNNRKEYIYEYKRYYSPYKYE